MRISSRGRAALFVGLVAALATQTAAAQDVQYRSVTKVDMGMGLNIALKMAGASEVTQTSYVQGKKMRTETDKSATIFDLDRSRFILINHADKSYITAPIGQMTAAFSQMAASSNTRMDKGQMKATAQDSAGNKMDFTFHVSVDPTDERATVNGQNAQRAFATIETDMTVTPQGEAKSTEAGKLVVLIDTWNANNGPAYTAVHNFQQAMSKELRDQTLSNMKGLGAVFAQNPQFGEAMKKAAAEQQKIDGIAMKSTVYLVAVPATMTFDRALVLKPADSGGGSAAKRAMGGFLSGALGGKAKSEKADQAPAKQATVMTMTTEIRDVQTTSLAASLFDIPAGYREIPFTPVPPTRE